MRSLPRAAMWAIFGVVVAVALSAGAFAVANGSIGEPAGPVSVSPQPTGKPAVESDRPGPTLRPSPSASPTHDGHEGGSQGPGAPSATGSPSSSPSHDDHGDNERDD